MHSSELIAIFARQIKKKQVMPIYNATYHVEKSQVQHFLIGMEAMA